MRTTWARSRRRAPSSRSACSGASPASAKETGRRTRSSCCGSNRPSLCRPRCEFRHVSRIKPGRFGYRLSLADEHIRWTGADEGAVPFLRSSNILELSPPGDHAARRLRSDRSVNPSANRWMFNPTVNYSYTPDQGWTWLEVYLSARVFTTNDDYRVGGASSLSQNPLFIVEGHASRNLSPALWMSADAYYTTSTARPASMGSASITPPTRYGSGWAWVLWSGPAATSASTTSAWLPSLPVNRMRRPF